jgi:ABC-type branched-subunit amino acid transport system substrate-binding protein
MKSRLFAVCVALVPVLVSVGCSGHGGGSGNGGGGDCDTPGVSPGKIELGLIYPTSGTTAPALQAARAGVDARIGVANAAGGVNGRKISYDWRDEESTPSGNDAAARGLVNGSNVFGILEENAFASGGAAFLATSNVPVIGLASELPVWMKYPNMVAPMSTAGGSDAWAQVFKQRGVTKVAVVSESLSSVDLQAANFIVASNRAVGISSTVLNVDPSEDPAVTARRITDTGADGLTGVIGNLSAFYRIAQLTQTASKPVRVVLSLSGYDRNLLRTTGGTMANLYIALPFLPFEAGGAAMNNFLGAMTQYAPQVADPRQEFALRSYIDTDLYLRGLQMAGPCPTRAGFLKAVHSLSAYDANGLIPPADLRPGAKQVRCQAFVRVNPAGTSFDVVSTKICGSGQPS